MQDEDETTVPATANATYVVAKGDFEAIVPCAFCRGAMQLPAGFPSVYAEHHIQMLHVDKEICATVLRERVAGLEREVAVYRKLLAVELGVTDAD